MKLSEQQVKELFEAAFELVGDFEHYGEVLQTDDAGEYSKESAIGRLQAVVAQIEDQLCKQNGQ